jgi:hypothetical protein
MAVLFVALALPAGATRTDPADPNDTLGALDIRAVTMAADASPRWRIETFSSWSVRRIWDHGSFVVELDTLGDETFDYLVVVHSDGRRLLATLVRVRSDGEQHSLGTLRADKAGPKRAAVSFPLRMLSIGENRASYSWSVVSSFTGPACPQTCLDHVPDEGTIEQPLPGVTPTPTPSPTPSPSPSPTPGAGP